MRASIFLVEDDEIMGESLCDRFELEGIDVNWYKSAEEAIEAFDEKIYALILTDIRLPDMSGEEMFYELMSRHQYLPPVMFVTGYGSVDKAVNLLKLGAADYITKPFDLDNLIEKVRALTPENNTLIGHQLEKPRLGVSSPMRRLETMLPRLASTNTSVLITGESGVGKEKVAQSIHELGDKEGTKPFVAVNCGALSASLLESELFGHEKGSFTGASKLKRGVFEQASGGTILLDEIGEMPMNMQVNLLRVIQDQSVTRVGGEFAVTVDVRIICATNRDLVAMVNEGHFREDLFYRINVIHLHIPPLRDRRDDIPWFARIFLSEYRKNNTGAPEIIDHSGEYALLNHTWPGNLRELKHCIERACVLSGQERLTADSLFGNYGDGGQLTMENNQPQSEDLHAHIRHCEKDFIVRVLDHHEWHVTESADALGISRKNLWEKMKKLDIHAPTESG